MLKLVPWQRPRWNTTECVAFIRVNTIQGTKIFQYCTGPAGRVTYNFHSSCKHMHLSFKSVCNREHKGVLCNMTYFKVPYITAKMIFTQLVSESSASHIMTTVNTQKMLVSSSDFSPSPSSNSSQSTRPTGRVLWEESLVLTRFHS